MKTVDVMLRSICSDVMEQVVPDGPDTRGVDRKDVDDQLYELQLLSLRLQQLALEVRQNGCTGDALWQALWQVVR